MTIKTYIFILLITLQCLAIAQTDSTENQARLKLYAFSSNAGGYFFSNYQYSQADLQKMNPNNQLLKMDVSSYENYGSNNENSGGNLSFNACFLIYNKKKKSYTNRQELRFGVSYQTNEKVEYSYKYEEKVRFDTLISNTSPKQYYIDSVKTKRYFYSNYSTNFLVDITHTFHSKQNRILSYYVGYNIGYGKLISNVTTVDHRYRETFRDQKSASYDYPESSTANIDHNERSTTKSGNVFQASIPIGGIMRFSNLKKNYVRRLALNLETKTGVKLTQIPNYGNHTQFFFNINFGLKYYLNRESVK